MIDQRLGWSSRTDSSGEKPSSKIDVRVHSQGVKRVTSRSHSYYYAPVNGTPYSLAIVLPEPYGHYRVEGQIQIKLQEENYTQYFKDKNWKVHPDWIYCENPAAAGKAPDQTPEDTIRGLLEQPSSNINWKNPSSRPSALRGDGQWTCECFLEQLLSCFGSQTFNGTFSLLLESCFLTPFPFVVHESTSPSAVTWIPRIQSKMLKGESCCWFLTLPCFSNLIHWIPFPLLSNSLLSSVTLLRLERTRSKSVLWCQSDTNWSQKVWSSEINFQIRVSRLFRFFYSFGWEARPSFWFFESMKNDRKERRSISDSPCVVREEWDE